MIENKDPCSWCVNTSEQIDSLEHQVEQLTEYNKLLRAAYDHVEFQLREDDMGGLCDSISEFHKNQAE